MKYKYAIQWLELGWEYCNKELGSDIYNGRDTPRMKELEAAIEVLEREGEKWYVLGVVNLWVYYLGMTEDVIPVINVVITKVNILVLIELIIHIKIINSLRKG